MMPTEPELLEDARSWVEKWRDAVGHTNMLSSFLMADEHWNADCWYIFSDGLADDPMQCVDFLEARIRHGQRVPIIHTVRGERVCACAVHAGRCTAATLHRLPRLARRRWASSLTTRPRTSRAGATSSTSARSLAARTKNTAQACTASTARTWASCPTTSGARRGPSSRHRPPGRRAAHRPLPMVPPCPRRLEADEVRVEREWAEDALRNERRKNIRLGIAERLDVTMARVQALHHQTRIQPLVKEHQVRPRAVHPAASGHVVAACAHALAPNSRRPQRPNARRSACPRSRPCSRRSWPRSTPTTPRSRSAPRPSTRRWSTRSRRATRRASRAPSACTRTRTAPGSRCSSSACASGTSSRCVGGPL